MKICLSFINCEFISFAHYLPRHPNVIFMATVGVERILRVQHGQLTSKFEKFRKEFADADSHSFSIIYDDTSTSLDLIAATEEEFNLWFDGLRVILKEHHAAQNRLTPFVRYLQALW